MLKVATVNIQETFQTQPFASALTYKYQFRTSVARLTALKNVSPCWDVRISVQRV